MSKWLRFKTTDGLDAVVQVGSATRKIEDGTIGVWDATDPECCRMVHPDDADRVWGELVAMCETPKLYGQGDTHGWCGPPLTYSRRTLDNGDTEIVLRSFTHVRGKGLLFEASNGIRICSWSGPDWYPNTLAVQGRVTTVDNFPILIPAADWPRVKQALDEYGAKEVGA